VVDGLEVAPLAVLPPAEAPVDDLRDLELGVRLDLLNSSDSTIVS